MSSTSRRGTRATGWVLYLRSSSDLAVLQAFARRLGHDAAREALSRPFVRYVASSTSEVTRHYHGLREAVPALRGITLFDRVPERPPEGLSGEANARGQAYHVRHGSFLP